MFSWVWIAQQRASHARPKQTLINIVFYFEATRENVRHAKKKRISCMINLDAGAHDAISLRTQFTPKRGA